jgi:hypothetical protein
MSLLELFMVKEMEILVPVVCFNHSVVHEVSRKMIVIERIRSEAPLRPSAL